MREAARVGLAAIALVVIALLVRRTGVALFVSGLGHALPWLPLLLLLEGARLASDFWAFEAFCANEGRRVRSWEWLRLHLEANTALVVLPGGRVVSEGMKVARLAPLVGKARATSVVAAQHATTMFAIALFGASAALLARRTAPALAAAMALHAALTLLGALALRVSLGRARVPLRALAAKVANRAAQAAQLGILLHVVGGVATLSSSLMASGLTLLGGLLGELSIAQLGCTEGAFVLGAPALSLSLSGVLLLTSLSRIVQLVWCLMGTLFPWGRVHG